jgi:hypothetical protein
MMKKTIIVTMLFFPTEWPGVVHFEKWHGSLVPRKYRPSASDSRPPLGAADTCWKVPAMTNVIMIMSVNYVESKIYCLSS